MNLKNMAIPKEQKLKDSQFNTFFNFFDKPIFMRKRKPTTQKKKTIMFLHVEADLYNTATFSDKKSWKEVDNWPRLLEIAYIICNTAGEEVIGASSLITPKGFTIQPRPECCRHLTQEKLLISGSPLALILGIFMDTAIEIDYFIAHNIRFDIGVVKAEMHRLGMPNLMFTTLLDAQIIAKDYTELDAGKCGISLKQLAAHFNYELDAPSAMGAAKALKHCFFKMVENTPFFKQATLQEYFDIV